MTDMNTVKQIESTLFTPALQKLVQQAKEDGRTREEVVLAAANAYLNMLVPLLGGRDQALKFLKDQVHFLESQT